jgi:hypothetical protein
MKTELGEVLRLSSANFFCRSLWLILWKESKGLVCMAELWQWRLSWHHTGWCIRTCRRRQSNQRPHISSPSVSPFYRAHSAIQTPSQVSAVNTDIIPVNSSTDVFTFIHLHIKICFVWPFTLTPFFLYGLKFVHYNFAFSGLFSNIIHANGEGLLYFPTVSVMFS